MNFQQVISHLKALETLIPMISILKSKMPPLCCKLSLKLNLKFNEISSYNAIKITHILIHLDLINIFCFMIYPSKMAQNTQNQGLKVLILGNFGSFQARSMNTNFFMVGFRGVHHKTKVLGNEILG